MALIEHHRTLFRRNQDSSELMEMITTLSLTSLVVCFPKILVFKTDLNTMMGAEREGVSVGYGGPCEINYFY